MEFPKNRFLHRELASFCRETGPIPRSANRCQMIGRVERALRRAFNKRAQERPLHLEHLLVLCRSIENEKGSKAHPASVFIYSG